MRKFGFVIVLLLLASACIAGKRECSPCSQPSEWSACADGKKTRGVFVCSAETKFECVKEQESADCEPESAAGFVATEVFLSLGETTNASSYSIGLDAISGNFTKISVTDGAGVSKTISGGVGLSYTVPGSFRLEVTDVTPQVVTLSVWNIEGRCTDGTEAGECSLSKPLYCNSRLQLVDLCDLCGCLEGATCRETGSCS